MHDQSLDISPDIAVWLLVFVAATSVIALAIGATVFALRRRNISNPRER